MAVDKSKLVGKLDILGVIKEIEHPKKMDNGVQTDITSIINLVIENPTTKSTVSIPFFTNEWDKLQYFDNGQPQRVSEQNATEEMKKKAIKYEIKGQKETKTYLTVKSFVESLKTLKGKKVKVDGNSRYRVNNSGFLQLGLEARKVEYVDQKTTDYRLSSHCYLLFSKTEIENMALDKELEMFVPLGTQNEYFKQKGLIPLEVFLNGEVKDDFDTAKYVLDKMREDCADNLSTDGYYLLPATIELESGKAFREPTESDVNQGKLVFFKAISKDNEELYQKKLQEEYKSIGLIPVERGTINISLIAFDKLDYVANPILHDISGNNSTSAVKNATQNSMQQAIELAKKRQSEVGKQVSPPPSTEQVKVEVVEEKVENSGDTIELNTNVESGESTENTDTTNNTNEDSFPF